jgi:hypothetical protein
MVKLKVQYKDAQIYIQSKLGRNEAINERELHIFGAKLIRGLMRPSVTKKNKITYSAPNGVTLQKYLRSGINKNDFFVVFAQIIEATKKIESNGFNINNLVLNLQYAFINEMTKEIHFIYQPIITQSIATNIFSFLYDLSHTAVFQLNEDIRFLNELIGFLRNMKRYAAQDIENYLLKIYPEVYKQVQIHKTEQNQILNNGLISQNSDDEETSLLDEDDDDGTALLAEYEDEGTSLLNEDEGTSLLYGDEDGGYNIIRKRGTEIPYLIRISNYDQVDINKPVFRIGKERSFVDYFIANNNAVSRLHADIITNAGSYYIRDNNSTNRTFVNGSMIEVNQDVQLFDKDAIMLANEAFEFHIS